MKYRLLALSGLAVSLSLGAAACSSSSSSPAASGATSSPASSPTAVSSSPATAAKDFGPGCAAVPKSGAGSFTGMATAPVATAASANPALSTLVTAVKAAGLVDTLNSASNITVFAPDNAAFAKIPPATLKKVLADKAELAAVDAIDTWRQWMWACDATPGLHTLQVRATDNSGATQTPQRTQVFPNGASGWDSTVVTVT